MPSPSCILVVEDDFDLRDSLAGLLKDEGCNAVAVATGPDALAWLRSHPAPKAILLDVMMPLMSGGQLFAELKKDPALAPIPVVVLSAMNDEQQRAEVPGATAYLRKPISIGDLLAALEL